MFKKYLLPLMLLAVIVAGMFAAARMLHLQEKNSDETKTVEKVSLDTIPEPEPTKLYGIIIDGKVVKEDKIKPNENLSHILSAYNVPFDMIHRVAQKSREVFDVRKMAAHKKYTVICDEDSLLTAKALIYEPSATEYVVFDLKDSIHIYLEEKPVEVVERSISGVINSSMYQTLMDGGASPMLASKLADVFAWQIDFFRIQKGDRFRVIFEEKQVEGKPVDLGRILAAEFEHFSNSYFAFPYDQGDGITYFDEEGKSLRKAFLKAPLEYSRISSRYTLRRYHPVQKRYKPHLGTDYAAPTGTPIKSVGDGVVLEASYSKYNGNYVKVKHNSVYTTQYLHMSKRASGIKPGKRIRQGEIIGYVGSTGLATGPHLCFRFWKNGRQVDALKVELPPSEPVKEEHREAYFAHMAKWKDKLNEIKYPVSEEDKKLLASNH